MKIKKLLNAIQIMIKYDPEIDIFQEQYNDDYYFTSSFDVSPNKISVEDVEKLHDDGWEYNKTLNIWNWSKDN